MPRKCQAPDCNWVVFGTDKKTGKGYCKFHQYLRTDLNRYGIQREPIKTVKKNTGEFRLFKQIWRDRKHVSLISGQNIHGYEGTSKFVNCFAHIIPKKGHVRLVRLNDTVKNRILRLNKKNIVLLTPFEHTLIDHGSEDERMNYVEEMAAKGIVVDFNIFYKLREELIKEINERYA